MGTIYFVRHGETVANEQNFFAGKMDVELTELGRSQAVQAGNYLRDNSLCFDEVHVSTLKRSQETAHIALKQSGQQNIPVFTSEKLMERDFGVFTSGNKNLLRKAAGYNEYETLLHSHQDHPLAAESFRELYERVEEYYTEVLRPRADSGQDILVVAHKYVVEMLALILADKPLEEYFDMRLPNGKPLREDDVASIFTSESKTLKHISDFILYSSSLLIMLSFFLGGFGKTLLQTQIAPDVFMHMVSILLAGSTFFVILGVNSTALKSTFSLQNRIFLPWVVRVILAGLIWFFWPHEGSRHGWLLLMMPPALTAPVSSLLWGGTLHLATKKTALLSLLAPLYLGGFFWLAGTNILSHLIPFIIVLVGAIFLPAALAQAVRKSFPIQAGKTSERWKWIGVVCVMLIGLLCGYRFTPMNLVELMHSGGHERGTLLFDGVIVLGIFTTIKAFSHASKWYSNCNSSEKVDVYVTHATPNIFLWISLFSMAAPGSYVIFWASILFFIGLYFDEYQFVQAFSFNFNKRHEALTAQTPATAASPRPVTNTVRPIPAQTIVPIPVVSQS